MRDNSLIKTFAKNLRAARDSKGFTSNRALAKKSGVSEACIRNYIKGDEVDGQSTGKSGKPRSPKLAEIEMLAAALDVPTLALLTDAGNAQLLASSLAAGLALQSGSELPKQDQGSQSGGGRLQWGAAQPEAERGGMKAPAKILPFKIIGKVKNPLQNHPNECPPMGVSRVICIRRLWGLF